MSSPIRLAILGTGRMGRIRAQHIFASPRFEISAVVDVNLAAAEKLAKEFRVANFGTSLEGVEYDGLVVSTPTFTHLSAIEGSKDNTTIFLEKVRSCKERSDELGIRAIAIEMRRHDKG